MRFLLLTTVQHRKYENHSCIPSGGFKYLGSTICSICSTAIASSRTFFLGVLSSLTLEADSELQTNLRNISLLAKIYNQIKHQIM